MSNFRFHACPSFYCFYDPSSTVLIWIDCQNGSSITFFAYKVYVLTSCLNTVINFSTMEVVWQLWLLTSSKKWHYVILWVCKDDIAITIKKMRKWIVFQNLFQSPLSICKVIYSFFWIEILKANFGWHINQKSATRKLNVGSDYSIVSRNSYSRMCPPPPPLPKSMVLRRFGLKTGIDFLHFSLESGMLFEGTTGVYERICRFNSKWIRRNASKMRIRNGFQEIFFRVDVLILGMMA